MLQPGLILRNYEIEAFLDRGIDSLIYKARDLRLERPVVIKEYALSGVGAGSPRREQILKKISHATIPRFFDFFSQGESSFHVMEWVPGTSLDNRLKREGSMPFSQGIEITKKIINILIYLHGCNPAIIHRDIQPIHFIENEFNLYLTDFSWAFCEGDSLENDFLPSPGYSAPELMKGERASVQSDLYSVGVILYQALSGKNPLSGEYGRFLDIDRDFAHYPPILRQFFYRALDPDPGNRFSSALDFSTELGLLREMTENARRCPFCGVINYSSSYFCYICGEGRGERDKDNREGVKTYRGVDPSLRHVGGSGPSSGIMVSSPSPSGAWLSSECSPSSVSGSTLSEGFLLPSLFALSRSPGFDTLITVDHNKIDEYPHQLQVVKRVLKTMGGRALLCDEVGLGKTIEAGIIMEELKARGLINSILIVTPSHLRQQWKEEMWDKFDEKFRIYTGAKSVDWDRDTRVIISIDSAKRKGKVQDAILKKRWSLLLVDEAHYARNRKTARWKFLDMINKEYCLLLTATPVHNHLSELFDLITLLRPGHLRNYKNFRKQFIDDKDKRKPKNLSELKELLRQVMVRTRRADAMIKFPRRVAYTRIIPPSPGERRLYDQVSSFIREIAQKDRKKTPFGLITLLQRLSSSPWASSTTLKKFSENSSLFTHEEKMKWFQLYLLSAEQTEPSKAFELERLLNHVKEKTVIFTGHVATLQFLVKFLEERGYGVSVYRGNTTEKQKALEEFGKNSNILLVSISGGEGLNLHNYSHVIINYDLPWNPMVLEQRIGRLQRLGQTRDVFVFNLAMADTVEEYLLRLLEEKIKMFNLSVGQMDLILGTRFEDADSFEQKIWERFTAGDEKQVRDNILSIGDELMPELENLEKLLQNDRYINLLV